MTMKRRVAVFAFGTRGDVLPLAAVTAALAGAHPAMRITFVTHAAHRNLEPHLARSGVARFVAVSPPPVVAAGDIGDVMKASLEAQLREECIAAMDVAMVGTEVESDACVLINLFALEGWHLAELFRVPCAALSPYVVPYSAPSSFERRFRGTHPLLYRRLREAGEGEVGWDEVMHWMWPLFTDRWAEWRTRRLRLSACPLTDPVTGLPVLHDWPCASRLLYGFSPQVVECPAYWPKSVTVCGFWFAPLDWEARDKSVEEVSSKPVSTHSPSLSSQTPRINIGPDRNFHIDVSTNYKPPVKLSQFLAGKKSSEGGSDTRPIFIGLSSMGSMGFLERPGSILKVLEAALEATNSTAILLTAGHAPLDLAVTQLCDDKKMCLDVSDNKKLRLKFGNGKLRNEKLSLDIDNNIKSSPDVDNEKLGLDHVGNKKLRLGVDNEEPCLYVGSNKLRLDVDNEKPCLDGVGNKNLCLDVDNEKMLLDVDNEKPCLDVGNGKRYLDVGNEKLSVGKPSRDGVGSRLHEGLTCFNGRLFCYSGAIPHLWLLPRCTLALHHGGSGTTAACLRAGVPQIICPFVLDQFYWAERMAWLGVAPQQPLKPEHLMPKEEEAGRFAEAVEVVAGAVREAASARVRGRAAWLREKIGGEEDGVAAAVAVLRSTFRGM